MEERKEKVRQAIANEELEGLSVTKATRQILDDYIVGKISAGEAAKLVFGKYGVE